MQDTLQNVSSAQREVSVWESVEVQACCSVQCAGLCTYFVSVALNMLRSKLEAQHPDFYTSKFEECHENDRMPEASVLWPPMSSWCTSAAFYLQWLPAAPAFGLLCTGS